MGSRKRGRDEMESTEPATEPSLLDKIRDKWEFANLMQYIFIFGKAVKIDEDLTIEVRPFHKISSHNESVLNTRIVCGVVLANAISNLGS